jgi:hypothetical protein
MLRQNLTLEAKRNRLEVPVRWEWKRYRHAFVYLAAEVIQRSRQRWLRFSPAHRFLPTLVDAHAQIQT